MSAIFRFSLFIGMLLACRNQCYPQLRYQPQRIETDIKLDGKLTEPEWERATPLSDFMQTSPLPGASATERTEVKLLYNNSYLCVGFHCYDSAATKLVRFFMDRDFELGKDDGISVQLDTYNDKNTAVVFVTNTLSARFDSEISGNGDNMNDDYNNFWDVMSVVDSSGYTAEFRIPFSSLRFEQKEKTIMGFRFARLIRRKNELITYPPCDSSLKNKWNNVSQEAELEFFNLKTKKPIYITPYVISNYEQISKLNAAQTDYTTSSTFFTRKNYLHNETLDKIISNIGADVKYGITKNFTLNLTVNTDFAQAEADNRIINLSKYSINLPEKRNFFLESQNYLNYQVGYNTQIFNSRRIGLENRSVVPIIGGIRITGKKNGWTIGALNMQTAGVKEKSIHPENFSVARLRKFYDNKGSFWGGIITNRISTAQDKVSNQSAGIDLVHKFNDKWSAGFGVVSTYDTAVKSSFDKNTFFNLFAFKNAGQGFTHGLDVEIVGKKFNPTMGFNPESDYGFVSLSNGRIMRIKGEHEVNFWSLNSTLEYRWKLESELTETKFANLNGNIQWKKGSSITVTPFSYKEDRLFDDWQLSDHILVPHGYYYMYGADANFLYDESKSYTFEFSTGYSNFYGGNLFTANPSANYIVNRFIRVGANYEFNEILFPKTFSDNENGIYKSNLIALNVTLTQSSKFSIKLLAQYDDNSDSFGGNLRFRYNPREGTDLFIVYNSLLNTQRLEAKPTQPLVDQQTIVVKYSFTFGL